MPGQPKRRAMLAALDARTRDFFELPDDQPLSHSHLDYAEAMIASGTSIYQLADDLGVSRETLRRHLYAQDPDHASERISRARGDGGHALAEQGLVLVDAPAETSVDVNRASSRARHRSWLAERWAPDLAIQRGSANITLNIGQLHLEALQARPTQANPAGKVTAGPRALGNNTTAQNSDYAQVVGSGVVSEL